MKQRVAYHWQQSAIQLEVTKAFEKENSALKSEKDKLQTDKERLEKEVNDVTIERNNAKDGLRLKTDYPIHSHGAAKGKP